MRKRTADVVLTGKNAEINFDQLLLPPNIVRGLKAAGFEKPSPIQLKAIPLGLTGVDIIAQAKSGTGKTCVFSVLALAAVRPEVVDPQVVIMAPTRELAVQSAEVIREIGVVADRRIRCVTFIGGISVEDDLRELRRPDGCHIIVGSPGRLYDVVYKRKAFNSTQIKLLVLDEADKMVEEESMLKDIHGLCAAFPQDKQILAFSATFNSGVIKTLSGLMKNPQRISLVDSVNESYCGCGGEENDNDHEAELSLRISGANARPTEKERGLELKGVSQFVFAVEKKETPYAQFQEKARILSELLDSAEFNQCLVFCSGKAWGTVLSEWLTKRGWRSAFLGGGRDTPQKERLAVMEAAKSFQLRVLVSTDLVARGVDIERVNMVVNFDMPGEIETYFHRVGRTGRFGTYGVAVNFVEEEDIPFIEQLEAHMGHKLTRLEDVKAIPKDFYAYDFETKEEKDLLTELKSSRLAVQLRSKAKNVDEEADGMACLQHVVLNAQKREAEEQMERAKKRRKTSRKRRARKDCEEEEEKEESTGAAPMKATKQGQTSPSSWWQWWQWWWQWSRQQQQQQQQRRYANWSGNQSYCGCTHCRQVSCHCCHSHRCCCCCSSSSRSLSSSSCSSSDTDTATSSESE